MVNVGAALQLAVILTQLVQQALARQDETIQMESLGSEHKEALRQLREALGLEDLEDASG